MAAVRMIGPNMILKGDLHKQHWTKSATAKAAGSAAVGKTSAGKAAAGSTAAGKTAAGSATAGKAATGKAAAGSAAAATTTTTSPITATVAGVGAGAAVVAVVAVPTAAQKRPNSNAANKNPKNVNKKLKKEYAKISFQNETLAKLITTKNSEIADLKNSSKSLHDILHSIPDDGFHFSPTLANHKLVQVKNQNRKLNVELMAAKKQLSKKELLLKQKDMNLRTMEKQLQKIRKFDVGKSNKNELKGHMNDLDKMISSVYSKNVELVSQLNDALKCLQMETGHKWDLKEFIESATDWKGRAQKIRDLEFQVKHYTDQIESYKRILNVRIPLQESEKDGIEYEDISSDEIIQYAKVRTLESEILSLRREVERAKSNSASLRVRNEALSEEVLQCRMLICSIEENAEYNKQNATTLRDYISQQQKQHEKNITKLNNEISLLRNELDDCRTQERILASQLEASEDNVRESSERIENLVKSYKKLEDDLKSYCGGFLFSCRDLHKEEFIGILESLENEKAHLLRQILELEEKLEAQVDKNKDLTTQLKSQQLRIEELEYSTEKKADRIAKDSKLKKSRTQIE